jgi:adenine-specific DNA-methyltransferase
MTRKATASILQEEQEPYRPRSSRRQHPGLAAEREGATSAQILPLARKVNGAYYTPDDVARSLTSWVIRSASDRLLDPACGDGRFIAEHRSSVGVDQDPIATSLAGNRAPQAVVHTADLFEWAASTTTRFDCAVGNPPFIRYQHFKGETRERALSLCGKLGVTFSGLTSSWAHFLVAAASLLRPGGRMAFVVPAEIGHAPYAAPLLEYLVHHFGVVHVIAIREKLFPELSEDCWLLYADRFSEAAVEIQFTALDRFHPSSQPARSQLRVPLEEWRTDWKRRLRPFLLPSSARQAYRELAARGDTKRFGELASIGIGYVSGGNDFFHLRPSQAAELGIPTAFLRPTLRNGRLLTSDCLTSEIIAQWKREDQPMLLLSIPKMLRDLPRSIQRYLDSAEGQRVSRGYKCRNRNPWYSVPDVHVPHFFLTYLSGRSASLVRNEARITCTNALHYVRLKNATSASYIAEAWRSPLTQLSCEIEGHPLGGGVLKLEPREASAVLMPSPIACAQVRAEEIAEAIHVMRSWRHYW